MPPRFRDNLGNDLRLGRRLGTGGEGAVFEIEGRGDLVAKVYHQPVPAEKAEKLASMARHTAPAILRFAAWPRATVIESGRMVGIVMPRINDARPIHELYSPAHRKVHFPKADWQFLIRTARNCAAAFATLHEHGIVIGDVNQGNLLVSSKALVTFIDCDSFQFADNGQLHLCRVGVPHFTPPELQSANLGQVVRTANHDLFGLAILIFHLLFMGRHPFAGKFLGTGDMPIERAIRENRFPYGTEARKRQMEPPPNAITFQEVPHEMARLFESAFCGRARPVATEWAKLLAAVENYLCKCDDDPGHMYYSRLPTCPWCRIVGRGGPNFFISVTVQALVGQGGVDVVAVWAEIQSTPRPSAAVKRTQSPAPAACTPKPLPQGLFDHLGVKRVVGWIAAIGCVLVLLTALVPDLGLFGAGFILVFGAWWAVLDYTSPLRHIRRERTRALHAAEHDFQRVRESYSNILMTFDARFQAKLSQLQQLKSSLDEIQSAKLAEMRKLQANVQQSQLAAHLQRHFISDAEISGIGPARISTLESYGIETAFDIDEYDIDGVPGFGAVYTQRLLDWRREVERRFRFNPAQGVSPADVQAIEVKYLQRRLQAERLLRHGPSELRQITNAAKAEMGRLFELIAQRETLVGQATADLALIDQVHSASIGASPPRRWFWSVLVGGAGTGLIFWSIRYVADPEIRDNENAVVLAVEEGTPERPTQRASLSPEDARQVEDTSGRPQRPVHSTPSNLIGEAVGGRTPLTPGRTNAEEFTDNLKRQRQREGMEIAARITQTGYSAHKAGDFSTAEECYRKALEHDPDYRAALNNLAWLLATCPNDDIRDGDEAVDVAGRLLFNATNVAGQSMTWSNWGALAASYAEAGDFTTAVYYQQMCINGAPEGKKSAANERLTLYKNRTPYRGGVE